MSTAFRRIVVLFVVMATLVSLSSTEIFSSSMKVQRMVEEEDKVLGELKRFIHDQFVRLKDMYSLYLDRVRDLNFRNSTSIDFRHPNAIFKVMQHFFKHYSILLKMHSFGNFYFQQTGENVNAYVADEKDVRGGITSLLRLQSFYKLRAEDMVKGEYQGFKGPQLDYVDAYHIGQLAMSAGDINESIDWLNTCLSLYELEGADAAKMKTIGPTIESIKAFLGRSHLLNGSKQIAEELYKEVAQLEPKSLKVRASRNSLHSGVSRFESQIEPSLNSSRLCSIAGRYDPLIPVSPLAVCRYKETVLPYYRFQEEILSVSPFVTLFYNVISDAEGNHIKDFVKDSLRRAGTGSTGLGLKSDIRISDVAWIHDVGSEVVASISRRVASITELNTEQGGRGVGNSEPFQVINYGLGGYYGHHYDHTNVNASSDDVQSKDDRLATIIIYLSDVEKGGATVFVRAGIAVTPVKNMALMWYNFSPQYKTDQQTRHAGCPVLVGQKWIASKLIWAHGNMFKRRCGLRPDATQLDIEADMMSGYQ